MDSKLWSIILMRLENLVDLDKDSKTISCKWIFRKKLKPDGTIVKFKVRLVEKGFK